MTTTTTDTYTITVTAEKLRICDDNELKLFVTPGAEEKPYWASRANYMYDKCVLTVSDILEQNGYDDLDGFLDDEIFSATYEA